MVVVIPPLDLVILLGIHLIFQSGIGEDKKSSCSLRKISVITEFDIHDTKPLQVTNDLSWWIPVLCTVQHGDQRTVVSLLVSWKLHFSTYSTGETPVPHSTSPTPRVGHHRCLTNYYFS